jgi:L-amino acid N-acyltransferase YncA
MRILKLYVRPKRYNTTTLLHVHVSPKERLAWPMTKLLGELPTLVLVNRSIVFGWATTEYFYGNLDACWLVWPCFLD